MNIGLQLFGAHGDFRVTTPSKSLLTLVTLTHILCSHILRCYVPHTGMEIKCSKLRDNKNTAVTGYSSVL